MGRTRRPGRIPAGRTDRPDARDRQAPGARGRAPGHGPSPRPTLGLRAHGARDVDAHDVHASWFCSFFYSDSTVSEDLFLPRHLDDISITVGTQESFPLASSRGDGA